MNCNPFTYGHRHLIEYASSQVEHLYIFVVEEDKSYFKFADRFAMVKKGTEDLANVTVLPSGQFIISTVTFAEYFNKDAMQGAVINPSMDIEIFAKHIAPALGIGKRLCQLLRWSGWGDIRVSLLLAGEGEKIRENCYELSRLPKNIRAPQKPIRLVWF